MKKKLIQILMLMVATVSVGSFVSCKDTNEDLYNELRSQMVPSNASLQEALDQEKAKLQDLLQQFQALKDKVDLIKSCECDEAALEARLQTQIDGLNTEVAKLWTALNGIDTDLDIDDIEGLRAALTTLENRLNTAEGNILSLTGNVGTLTGQVSAINTLIPQLQAAIAAIQTELNGKIDDAYLQTVLNGVIASLTAQINGIDTRLKAFEDPNLIALVAAEQTFSQGLDTRIKALEAQIANINSCTCDFTDILRRLNEAEIAISTNQAWAQGQIALLESKIGTAQTTADNAYTLATSASRDAQQALADAARIEGLANAAQAAADAAQGDATAAQAAAAAAQSAADAAYAYAARALDVANQANSLAINVYGLVQALTPRVEANERNIAQLQQDARDLLNLIIEKEGKLNDAINKVKDDLEKKVDDLQDEIQGKLDTLKDYFEGKIDNTNDRITNEVSRLTGLIDEVKNAVSTNTDNIKANADNIAKNAAAIQTNAEAIKGIVNNYNEAEIIRAKKEHRDPLLIPLFSCHYTRHTFCSRFCETETNIKVIQIIMGHKDIRTTMDIYAEITEARKREAIDKLSENMDIF